MKTPMKQMSLMTVVLLLWAGLMNALAQAGETVTYYHPDALGSPAAATDSAGNPVWLEEYLAYGARIRQQGTANNTLWYTGKFHDEDTGLTYFGARWYDPVVGRFMGVDPAGYREDNVHSFNRYAYANNNPHGFVDPDGRAAETAWDAFNLAVGTRALALNVGRGNVAGAAVDSLGLVFDLAATLVPFVPAGASTAIAAVRGADGVADVAKNALKDGDSLSTNDALDAALDHLGSGYREIALGVFKSADGTKVVRMTESDLAKTGNHAGAPHMNFETGKTVKT